MTTAAATHVTVRFAAASKGPKAVQGSVLLIEDDVVLARTLVRVMNAEGYEVVHVGNGTAALDKVMNHSFDVVISDLNLPGTSGVDVLNVVRAYDPDLPLVLMTGSPTVDTAIEACNLGVLEYLVKPMPRDQLSKVLGRATKMRRSAMLRRQIADDEHLVVGTASTLRPVAPAWRDRETLALVSAHVVAPCAAPTAVTLPELSIVQTSAVPSCSDGESSRTYFSVRASFDRAMTSLVVDLEPITDAKSKKLMGFAARMSSTEETLTTESALIVAAEQVNRLVELRRRVRDLAVMAFASAPADALLFVDVHPSDLMEGDLYSPEPSLARIAERVVLQVHARGLSIVDLSARASVLRFVGFRLAIADLDAGHACLAQIADLSPEFVKINARLIRGVDGSANRRRLVSALVSMCRSLDAVSIAEGVSTAEECEAVIEAGCGIVQGSIGVRLVPASQRYPQV